MQLWTDIDAGKAHHHCVVIDADGNRVLSQRVSNDEPALLQLMASVLELAGGDQVVWATGLNHGGPALLIALLVGHGQDILYIPGRTVHHASKIYRGEGKTDAKDAAVIADQARMRTDLQPLRAGDEISTGLWLLTARRADKSVDRVRAITVCRRSCSNTLNEELAELDAMISEKVIEHQHTEVLLSMPGFGPVLAAELLGATGGDLSVFESADRFAGVVGLAPAPWGSGRISGNHHRPRRYDRRLLRVFYLSGLSALKSCPASRGCYDRKRVEGKSHIQVALSLARRRLNVLWAVRATAQLTL